MIKLFEQYNNEKKIQSFCSKYFISNYEINPDGSIDVNGDVDIDGQGFSKIPIKFNKVTGDFDCANNKLTTLENCPVEVNGGFSVDFNELTSLDGGPKYVGKTYSCRWNKLTSLKSIPDTINMSLNCSNNKITTLIDFPKSIRESLYMNYNPISIIDNSIIVGKSIHIENTNFTNNIIYLDKEKLRILFENAIDYNIYHPSGEIYYNRLERMFKDFNI